MRGQVDTKGSCGVTKFVETPLAVDILSSSLAAFRSVEVTKQMIVRMTENKTGVASIAVTPMNIAIRHSVKERARDNLPSSLLRSYDHSRYMFVEKMIMA